MPRDVFCSLPGTGRKECAFGKIFSLYRNFYLTCQVKMYTPAFISTKHHFFCFPGSSRDGLLPRLQPDSEAAPAESPGLLLLPAATQTLRHRGHRAHANTKGDNPQTLKTLTAWPMPAQNPIAFTPYSDRILACLPVPYFSADLSFCLSGRQQRQGEADRSTGQVHQTGPAQKHKQDTNQAQQTPDTALFPAQKNRPEKNRPEELAKRTGRRDEKPCRHFA